MSMIADEETAWPDVPPTQDLLRWEGGRPSDAGAARLAAFWRASQWCTHVMASNVPRDSWTGWATPQRLSGVLADFASLLAADENQFPDDSLAHIVEHCAEALDSIIGRPRVRLRRERRVLPLHRARDLDSASVQWLAQQPGRNIREKLGQHRRILAPVRIPSLDLPENRVLRQLADRLRHLLAWRLAGHDEGGGRRAQLYRRLEKLCGEVLEAAGFGDLSLHPVTRPNNALLSDRHYRRIWQAWTWLGTHRRDVERAWHDYDERITEIAFWSLIARMKAYPRVDMDDVIAERQPGFGTEGFGIFIPAALVGTVELWVSARAGGRQEPHRLFRLWRTGCDIYMEAFFLHGEKGLLPIEGRPTYPLLSLVPPAASTPRRSFLLDDRSATPVKYGLSAIDGPAFMRMAQWVADRLVGGLPASARTGAGRTPIDARLVGLDCAGVRPRLFVDGLARGPAIVTALRRSRTASWRVVGRADAPFAPSVAGAWLSVPSILDGLCRKELPSQDALASLSHIFGALWEETVLAGNSRKAAGVSPPRALAVTVSSLLPDLALRHLRSAVAGTSIFDETWLVERSTAAALGWQSLWANRPAVARGQWVVVIDAEAGVLHLSPLRADHHRDLAGAPHHGIFWTRDLRLQPMADDAGLTARSFQADYLDFAFAPAVRAKLLTRTQAEALASDLIEQGEAERLLDHGGIVHIKLPLDAAEPTHVLRLARDDDVFGRAASRWSARYRDWMQKHRQEIETCLDAWCGVDPLRPRYGAPIAWHLLYAGKPFHDRAIAARSLAAWDEIAKAWERKYVFTHHALPEADRLAALGCHAFLSRHQSGLRTWKDLLAPIFLEVDAGDDVQLLRILPPDKAMVGAELASSFVAERNNEVTFAAGPGDTLTYTADSMVLGAHAQSYLLPMLESVGAERQIRQSAVLSPPGFPLPHDLRVDLHVNYDYGASDLRLSIRPAAGPQAGEGWQPPFDTVDATWITTRNILPEFERDRSTDGFARKMDLAAVRLAAPRGLPHVASAARLALSEALRALALPPAWPEDSAASVELAGLRAEATSQWLPFLGTLAAAVPRLEGAERKAWMLEFRRICEALAEAAFLGARPSDALLATFETLLDSPQFPEQNFALRLLGHLLREPGEALQARLFQRIVDLAIRRRNDVTRERPARRPFEWLNPPLDAIAMILNARPHFLDVEESVLIRIIGLPRRVLDELATSLPDAQNVDDRFLHGACLAFLRSCELLAGLLQMRSAAFPADHARHVEAGTPIMHEMAGNIRAVNARFQSMPFAKPPSRMVRLQNARDDHAVAMDRLAGLLYALLAGHDPHQRLRYDASDDLADEEE